MLEIERKYEAADDLVVPDLASVRGVASVTDPVEHVLTASYFDTADRVLAMWGVTVRRRVGGSDEGWHLKLPSAVAEGERHEIRLALGRAKHTVPKPFRSTLRGLVGDRELVRVATLSTRRTVRELLLRDPLARENLPDGVHTMRVAVRRLRSVLATGRPSLDRSITEPLRDELSWLSDALGEARDAEMQRARLDEAIDALVEERRDLDWEPSLLRPALLGPLVVRQETAVAALREVLDGDRYSLLLDRLRALVADPPWTAKAGTRIRGHYRRRLGH